MPKDRHLNSHYLFFFFPSYYEIISCCGMLIINLL